MKRKQKGGSASKLRDGILILVASLESRFDNKSKRLTLQFDVHSMLDILIASDLHVGVCHKD